MRFRGQKCHGYGSKVWEFWVVTMALTFCNHGTFTFYGEEANRLSEAVSAVVAMVAVKVGCKL